MGRIPSIRYAWRIIYLVKTYKYVKYEVIIMANKEFAESLKKLIQERVGYGHQLTPVREAVWPNTKMDHVEMLVPEQQATPSSEPSEDVEVQSQPEEVPTQDDNAQMDDMEVGGEILSLLVSIGYILECHGIIENKYD